jgi:hypothetical protein
MMEWGAGAFFFMEVCADSRNWEWILVEIDSVGIWLGSPPPAIKLATANHGGNMGISPSSIGFVSP